MIVELVKFENNEREEVVGICERRAKERKHERINNMYVDNKVDVCT